MKRVFASIYLRIKGFLLLLTIGVTGIILAVVCLPFPNFVGRVIKGVAKKMVDPTGELREVIDKWKEEAREGK